MALHGTWNDEDAYDWTYGSGRLRGIRLTATLAIGSIHSRYFQCAFLGFPLRPPYAFAYASRAYFFASACAEWRLNSPQSLPNPHTHRSRGRELSDNAKLRHRFGR